MAHVEEKTDVISPRDELLAIIAPISTITTRSGISATVCPHAPTWNRLQEFKVHYSARTYTAALCMDCTAEVSKLLMDLKCKEILLKRKEKMIVEPMMMAVKTLISVLDKQELSGLTFSKHSEDHLE